MIFVFRRDEVLLQSPAYHAEHQPILPGPDLQAKLGLDTSQWQIVWPGQTAQLCTKLAADHPAPDGYEFHKLRTVIHHAGTQGGVLSRAAQVAEWARSHRYCGVCGTGMQQSSTELCFHCPGCGFSAYPRISPAMMILIKRDNKVLLARHSHYATQRYSALAGFVEAGESLEQTIHREVMEEVGLKVNNIRYFGSQSWPFPHSLMVAFTADYEAGDLCLQADEISDAQWYGPNDALPEIPGNDSIAGRLIRANLPHAPIDA
ncbi:NAD(+) diphosphatase [Alcaligenes endophyticus]|uniref:NAD(+) diphosphatase n=1 Tax=Alcaligenes endophyticus TaxID=1929088 RepID=A0ABT8EKT4_9BURK|nr:NAD(+) diphosphatase [Alcaligenes endophyticus]MCX5590733.1 NAD(+) diphosphatase [Alcaligenes endophyticus]MDN4121903.1 NAD(+) diphosphatase [Alcaligenes endophyticus]